MNTRFPANALKQKYGGRTTIKAQTNANMADIQTKQMAYFAGRTAAPKKDMTQEQLSNLFKELVPRRK